MVNSNSKLAQVEQELDSLRSKLTDSLGIIDSLSEVQAKFENLGQTYQQLQQHLEKVPGSLQDLGTRVDQIQGALDEIQNNLEEKVNQQIEPILQRGIDEKISELLEDWNNQKEAIQASMQRLYQLDNWTQQASSSMSRLEGQVKFLRNLLFAVTLIVFITVPVLFLR